MADHPLQDTLHFHLTADKTVTSSTVKIIAKITALKPLDKSEEDLTASIRRIATDFIDSEKWSFSNMQRASDAGMERVTLIATVRVPESENHSLEERAHVTSMPGLQITEARADTSVPQDLISSTESDLRVQLLTTAMAEMTKINECTGRDYRLGRITFNSHSNFQQMSNQLSSAPRGGATVSMKTSYGSGFGEDDETLGNAAKLSMTADVILSVTPA